MPKLSVVTGVDAGKQYELIQQTVTIGRHSGNVIYLSDNRVSRRHLELRAMKDGGWQLHDLRSGNGTLVNGRMVQVADLRNEDLITIGDTVMKFTGSENDPPDTETSSDHARLVVRPTRDYPSSILRTVAADAGSRILADPDMAETEWLRTRLASLAVMYETTTAVSRITDVDELLGKIMDLVMRTTDADNGCVMLSDPETGELLPKAVRSRDGGSSSEFVVSRTVVDYVLREGQGVLVADAGADERFRLGESILRHRIREVICVPMKGRHETVGVLFLDTRGAAGLPGISPDVAAQSRKNANVPTRSEPTNRPTVPGQTQKPAAQITTLVMTPGPRSVGNEPQMTGRSTIAQYPSLKPPPDLKAAADPKSTPSTFTEDHLHLAVAIAHQAGTAVEGTRYYNAMVQSERLAAVGQTIAALSHHIKNIMQGVRFGSDMVRMGLDGEDKEILRKGWKLVEKNQVRIDELILDMLSYSKDREPALETTDLNSLVEDVVETVRGRAVDLGVKLEWVPDPALRPFSLDSDGIHRAVLNIVSNAIDAVGGRENPHVVVTTTAKSDRSFVEIIVTDNGPGIPEEKLEDIFKPFVSTKGSRGTGLGLPVSRKILREHKGDVTVESAPGRGSRFVLRLPADAAVSEAEEVVELKKEELSEEK